MPRPYVVAHMAVTLDGATIGFPPAIGRFYELAGTWREDVTLAGADTILAQELALWEAPRRPAPATTSPHIADRLEPAVIVRNGGNATNLSLPHHS